MYIFTDSTNRVDLLFSGNHQWEKLNTEKLINHEYEQLVSKLIKNPSFTEMETELGWHSLIHTQFSTKSQFDILTGIAKNGPELPDGILCHADSGNKFHGQKHRSWETSSGNIHLSVLLTPHIPTERMNSKFLTMAVISVIETIDSFPGLREKSKIKWPNDIYINNSKVGGILTQCFTSKNRIRAVILGIGLNVEAFPEISGDKFTPKAGCLKDYSESVVIKSVFQKLLDSLYTHYQLVKNNQTKKLHDLYINRSIVIGKNCAVYSTDVTNPDFIGKVSGLGNDLELMFENNAQSVRNGRVEILYS